MSSEHVYLNDLNIRAISYLARDLKPISSDPLALEASIRSEPSVVRRELIKPLPVRRGTGEKLRVGDLVVFKPRNVGAYDSIEVLGGRGVPIETDCLYIGVLCERQSGKSPNAQFVTPPVLSDGLDLQLICIAGGVGFATGFSVLMANKNGRGHAGDVEIIGVIFDPDTGRNVNTIDSCYRPEIGQGFELKTPLVIVAGSGADVGKTTTAGALIKELARHYVCAAIKGTGTGRFADTSVHLKSGASWAVNQTDVGLPTTYLMDELFADGARQMFRYAAEPHRIPDHIREPKGALSQVATPDVILAELGGDLGEAGIPHLLNDAALVGTTAAVVLCCEGALALSGALEQLRESSVFRALKPPVYAAMPWGNVEGVYVRFAPFVESGAITGLVDILKPQYASDRDWRLRYSIHHDKILSVADLIRNLRPAIAGEAAIQEAI